MNENEFLEYSLSELEGCLNRVDREAFPENYEKIIKAIEHRKIFGDKNDYKKIKSNKIYDKHESNKFKIAIISALTGMYSIYVIFTGNLYLPTPRFSGGIEASGQEAKIYGTILLITSLTILTYLLITRNNKNAG